MTIKKHIPPFVDGIEGETVAFRNLAELLEIPWVKWWIGGDLKVENRQLVRVPFYRFSLAYTGPVPTQLMVELDGGGVWWVVGHLGDVLVGDLALPNWREGVKRRWEAYKSSPVEREHEQHR